VFCKKTPSWVARKRGVLGHCRGLKVGGVIVFMLGEKVRDVYWEGGRLLVSMVAGGEKRAGGGIWVHGWGGRVAMLRGRLKGSTSLISQGRGGTWASDTM